jgi:hypothetical protein
MLYVSPGAPLAAAARSASQWSVTKSQSRMFCPSPYTGSDLFSSAFKMVSESLSEGTAQLLEQLVVRTGSP